MKHTKNQTTGQTLTDLNRALDRQHPVTITALKEEKDANGRKTGRLVPTVRTLELYDIQTTAAGNVLLVGMDRETGKRRSFRLDRLISYSVHRTAYVIPRETPTATETPATPAPVFHTPGALVAYEIGRDERASHYQHAA